MTELSSTMGATWTAPTSEPDVGAGRAGRGEQDLLDWRELTARIAAAARANNWSKAEVSRRSGVPEGTFSQWYSAKYAGRLDETNTRLRQWLDTVEEMQSLARGIPASPQWVETRTSREISEALLYAQTLADITVITLAAGMGKTHTCRQYCAVRPHAYIATMSPHTKTVHGMLVEIAASLNVTQHNPAKLHRSIGERLQRNGKQCLLIIDEAQNLVDAAVDQLRSFADINECGIALVGNQEIYDRFRNRADGPSYAQIKRRFGKRLRRLHPYPEDITALIDAWGITDEASRRMLVGIGNKPGALGQVDKTLKLAGIIAEGGAITQRHIKAAWENRAMED